MKKEVEYYASLMYETYCREVGGKSFNGDPLPSWEDFYNDPQKVTQAQAWIRAADAVLRDLGTIQ